jgi:hypothetical protein
MLKWEKSMTYAHDFHYPRVYFLPNPGPDLVQDLPAKNLNVVDPFDYLTPFPPSQVDDPFFKNYF